MFHNHRTFLGSLKNVNPDLYSPQVVRGVHLNGTSVPNVILALWSAKSAVIQGLCIVQTQNLVQNLTHAPIQVSEWQPLGMLVDSSFHDVPVVVELPPSLVRDHNMGNPLFTFPSKIITIACHKSLRNEAFCNAALSTGGDLVVYLLVVQPGDNTSGADGTHLSLEEPYPGFEYEIDQQLPKADALMTEDQRDVLQKLFLDFQTIFAKD